MDYIELHEKENIAESSPTILEVEDAVRKLKNSKATGMHLIWTKLIKNTGKRYIKGLQWLMTKILNTEQSQKMEKEPAMPNTWKGDIILFKYRGISVLCTA